jgi:glucans biosynthesis protein
MDNIGAYWVSDKPVTAGSHLSMKYRLTFGDEPAEQSPAWHVTDSRIQSTNDSKTFEIEFRNVDGPATTVLPTPTVTCDSGAIESIQALPNKNGGLVVRFAYRPADAKTAHIQAQLHTETQPVSENWSYLWTRN